MARTDPYMKVRWEAEQLLKELGGTSLPVDPFDIAEKLGIALKAMPANAGGGLRYASSRQRTVRHRLSDPHR